jgi:hypothetical protein
MRSEVGRVGLRMAHRVWYGDGTFCQHALQCRDCCQEPENLLYSYCLAGAAMPIFSGL